VNYLPIYRFPCQGVDHRWCRERRDSEVSRTFVHDSSSAPSRIESAAHTPSRVSRGSSQAFAITTGSSRSRQALASRKNRPQSAFDAGLVRIEPYWCTSAAGSRLYRPQAIARGLRLLRSPAKMVCVRECTAPSLFVTVTLLFLIRGRRQSDWPARIYEIPAFAPRAHAESPPTAGFGSLVPRDTGWS
jgi:hypothetical protein